MRAIFIHELIYNGLLCWVLFKNHISGKNVTCYAANTPTSLALPQSGCIVRYLKLQLCINVSVNLKRNINGK